MLYNHPVFYIQYDQLSYKSAVLFSNNNQSSGKKYLSVLHHDRKWSMLAVYWLCFPCHWFQYHKIGGNKISILLRQENNFFVVVKFFDSKTIITGNYFQKTIITFSTIITITVAVIWLIDQFHLWIHKLINITNQ